MSNQLQPKASHEDQNLLDQPKADYKAGREFYSKGDYGQAAMALHNALRGFEEQENEQGIANAADRLGDVCMAKEQYRMALEHYQRSYAICDKLEDIFSRVSLDRKMVETYRKLAEPENGLNKLFRIFDHYAETRNPKGTVEVLETISEVYLEMGENSKAADALRTIAGIHRNFKHSSQAEQYAGRADELERK